MVGVNGVDVIANELFQCLRGAMENAASREARHLVRLRGNSLLKQERHQPLGTRTIEMLEFAAAAADGAVGDREPKAGVVWFYRDWLQRLSLDPVQCAVLPVHSNSWSPLSWAGDSILVDRSPMRRWDG